MHRQYTAMFEIAPERSLVDEEAYAWVDSILGKGFGISPSQRLDYKDGVAVVATAQRYYDLGYLTQQSVAPRTPSWTMSTDHITAFLP